MNEITDRNYCLIMRGGYRFWLNEKQAQEVGANVAKGIAFVKANGLFLNAKDIVLISPRQDVEWMDRTRKGEYYCEKHKQWIPRNNSCGYC